MTAPTPAKHAAEIKSTADREAATNFHPIDGANTHPPKEQVMSDLNRNPAADNQETVHIEGDGTNYTSHGEADVIADGPRISLTLPDRHGISGALIDLTRADAVDFAHAILSAAGETETVDMYRTDPLGRIWQDIDHDGRCYSEYIQHEGAEIRDDRNNFATVSAYRTYFDDGEVRNTIAIEANTAHLTVEQADGLRDQLSKAIDATTAPTTGHSYA